MPFDSGCKAAPQSADTHCQIGVCFHKTSVKTHPRGNGKVGDSNALSRRAEALVKLNFPFSACFRPVSAPPEQHIPLSRFCFPAAQPAADCRPFAVPPEKPKHLTIKKTHLFISDTAAFFTPLKIPSLWIQSSSPKCCTFSKSFFDL